MATDQKAWRLRSDSGNETTAAWLANQGVSAVVAVNTNFRARFLVQISGGVGSGINNLNIQFQYSTDGSNWSDVNGTSVVVRSSASPNLADNATTTQQLTGGTGSYQGATGFDESVGNAGGPSMDVADDGCFEVEFCAQVRSADVTDNQTIYLRTWNADASAVWTTYTGGTASITAVFPAKTIALSADPLGGYADSPPTIAQFGYRRIAPAADPWTNFDDTNGVTYDEPSLGATPLAPTIPADPMPAYGEQLGLALSYSGDAMSMADQPPTIVRRRVGWGDVITVDRQEAAQQGDITRNLTGDTLNTWADSHVTFSPEPVSLPADALANYADSLSGEWIYPGWLDGITVTKQDVEAATPKPITPDADVWGNLADSPPTINLRGTLSVALAADPWANLADAPPTVDKRGTIAISLTGDAMTMTDTPATVAETGKLTVSPSADPNVAYTDAIAGQSKSYNVIGDLMSLADQPPTVAMTGALAVQPTADANAAYADQLGRSHSYSLVDDLNLWQDQPSVTETGRADLTVAPLADPMVFGDQPVALAMTGKLEVTLAADLNAAYTDQLAHSKSYQFSDNWQNLGELTPTVDKQDIAATPKAATPPADTMTMADVPAIVAVTGRLELALAADPMAMGDAPPTVGMTAAYAISLPADPLSFGDLPPVVAAGGDLRYSLAADNFANYADTFKQSESYRLAADDLRNYDDEVDNLILAKRYPLSADPWANLGDSPPTVSKPGRLTVAPPANAMTMADAPPTIINTTLKAPALPADAMPAYGERLGVTLGFVDPWATLNDAMRLGWAFRLSADAMSMVDQMQLAAGGDLPFTLPADPMTLQDAVAVTYGKSYAPSADAMSMGDQPVAYGAGIQLTFSDDLDDWQDSRETVEGLAPQLADDLNEYLDEMRIRGIIPAEIIRLSGKLNTSVGLSGKVIDKVGLSGHINGNRIGVSGKLYEGD